MTTTKTPPKPRITALECTLLAATIPHAELARSYDVADNTLDDDASILVDYAAGDFEAVIRTASDTQTNHQHTLVLAAAHINLFVQHNISGPIKEATFAPELAMDGEDASILVAGATHLTAAYKLLLPMTTSAQPNTTTPTTTHWWALRCCVLRQRVLAHPSATLASHVNACIQHLQHTIPSAPLYVELALAHQLHGHVADAAQCLSLAEQYCGCRITVDGVMGTRTKHQQQPKAQLVVADGGLVVAGDDVDEEGMVDVKVIDDGVVLDADEEQDVLPLPILTTENNNTQHNHHHRPILHALLLTNAKQVQRATAADELQAYQMAPYVEAVLRQPTTTPACRYAARLLRARHERTRSRTRARSLLAYESLLDALRRTTNNNTQLSATSRLLYALATPLPLHTQLRKEAAEEMVACGLVGQAITEYEALQAWDALVACYRLLGKTQAAEQLVQERLQVEPTRASLWCTLGDLRLDDAHYHHALEVSNGRSVRAMRSLARSAMNRKEFDQAAVHWEAALAFNPLHEQGWFALGYCCLKHGDHTRALQAFTRAAQLDPENAEAWNNIAAVHMQHDNLEPAYAALTEALKRTRDNWRMWSNYATIAAATQHWPQALQAVQRVMTLTQQQEIPVQVLHDAVGPQGPTPPPPLLGLLFKQAAASSHATGSLWAAYASYFERCDDIAMARECLLKAVRALQGRTEERGALVEVTQRLALVTLQGVERGLVGVGELGGVRLQLRGLLRLVEKHGDGDGDALQELLQRVEQQIAAG